MTTFLQKSMAMSFQPGVDRLGAPRRSAARSPPSPARHAEQSLQPVCVGPGRDVVALVRCRASVRSARSRSRRRTVRRTGVYRSPERCPCWVSHLRRRNAAATPGARAAKMSIPASPHPPVPRAGRITSYRRLASDNSTSPPHRRAGNRSTLCTFSNEAFRPATRSLPD